MKQCKVCNQEKELSIISLKVNNNEYSVKNKSLENICPDCLLTIINKTNRISIRSKSISDKIELELLAKEYCYKHSLDPNDLIDIRSLTEVLRTKSKSRGISYILIKHDLINIIKIWGGDNYYRFYSKKELNNILEMLEKGSFTTSKTLPSREKNNNYPNVWIKDDDILIYTEYAASHKVCPKCLQSKDKKNYAKSLWKTKTGNCKSCDCKKLRSKEKTPAGKIIARLRADIHAALNYPDKYYESIGCTGLDLKKWLESKFSEEMNWDNYGKGYIFDENGDTKIIKNWQIDHIKPPQLFNVLELKEKLMVNHYTNLQPLWKEDNMAKGNKTPDRFKSVCVISGIEKQCTKCLKVLSVSLFSRQKKSKDGLKYVCKGCCASHAQKRYSDHKDIHIRKVNKWQIENAEKVRKYKAEWAAKQLAAPDPEKK